VRKARPAPARRHDHRRGALDLPRLGGHGVVRRPGPLWS
jgi:hypothetical protein